MKRKGLLAFLTIIAITTSGCGIFPKEEVLPEAPVLPTYKEQEYNKVNVMRGDIQESVQVKCTYKAYRIENLNFGVDGVFLDHVYVKEGDSVKAGDVLADLDLADIKNEIETYKSNIELIKLKLSNEEELKQLAFSNQRSLKQIKGYTNDLSNSIASEIDSYESAIEKLKDDLYIEKERFEQANEMLKKYQITAGMDGIVSFVADYKEGDTSKMSTFMTLYDPDTMLFVTDGKQSDLFKADQELTVVVNDDSKYKVKVIHPEDIFTREELKKQQEEQESEEDIVYLQCKEQGSALQNGTQGYVNFITKERKNVLYLPSKAVYQENGKSVVYVEDKDGFKSIKEIKTGVTANQKVEIVSGLKEGESVILEQ